MANSSKKKSGLQRGESKAAFLFCTPAVVLALVFIILPFATDSQSGNGNSLCRVEELY